MWVSLKTMSYPSQSHLPSPSLFATLFFFKHKPHFFGTSLQKGLSVIASHFVADDGLCDRLYKTVLLKSLDEILSKFSPFLSSSFFYNAKQPFIVLRGKY